MSCSPSGAEPQMSGKAVSHAENAAVMIDARDCASFSVAGEIEIEGGDIVNLIQDSR
jgi:hypothetical protein